MTGTTLARLTALALAAAAALPALAALPVPARAQRRALADCRRGEEAKSISIRSDSDERDWQVKWASDGCLVDIRTRGEVGFASDLSDVERIARGGRFAVTQRSARSERTLVVTPGSGGALERKYTVDGEERDYDAEAAAWLAEVLIEAERRTAFGAKTRVPRLYREGGTRAVLDEIGRLRGDYARRVYYQELFGLDQALDSDTRLAILRQAAREVSSDYEKAELLIAMAKRNMVDASSHQAYVDAVGTIRSDYERRRALTPLLKQERLDADVVAALLRTAGRIGSDYEKAELLIDVAQRFAVDHDGRDAFFEAVGNIGSDYEHRRVLQSLLKRNGRDKETLRRVLESAQGIDSDYELAELLVAVSGAHPIDDDLRPAYLKAADTIGSDHEFRRVLSALRKSGGL